MFDNLNFNKNIKIENALYVVSTPIGNLADITIRALQIIGSVNFIICEDTRVSSLLLKNYNIPTKNLLTYNDYSNQKMRDKILDLLKQNNPIALISDAGTPLLSDPGYKLINFLRKNNQKIIPIPGASSLTAAISISSVACDNFIFIGFLPNSISQKEKLLKSLDKNITIIFFETAKRIMDSLEIINKNFSTHRVLIARELTKIYEEVIVDNASNLMNFFNDNQEKLKGEFVVIIEKSDNKNEINQDFLLDEIRQALSKKQTIKDIADSLSKIYEINKKEIYKLALNLDKKS